MIVVWSLIEK